MTDKEKIEQIIQDKHLNNTEFCNEVCISPGTLSHIRSGRTEPTLNILRSIVQAFPDINPAWLFYGEEPMYKNVTSPTPANEVSDDTYINNEAQEQTADGQLPLFAFGTSPAPKGNVWSDRGASTVVAQGAGGRRSLASGAPSSQGGIPAVLNVQEIVAETLKQQQRPQRKVVEVRIFFDDGTFETFGNK